MIGDPTGMDYALRLLSNVRWVGITHSTEIQDAIRTSDREEGAVSLPSSAVVATGEIYKILKRSGMVEEGEGVSYRLEEGLCGTHPHAWITLRRPTDRRLDPLPMIWIVDPHPPGLVGGPLLVAPHSPFQLFYKKRGE